MELVIKASRGGSLPDRVQARVAKLLQKRERAGVFALDDGNFEYNDVKVKTQVGGRIERLASEIPGLGRTTTSRKKSS